jgi:hypothetical protein
MTVAEVSGGRRTTERRATSDGRKDVAQILQVDGRNDGRYVSVMLWLVMLRTQKEEKEIQREKLWAQSDGAPKK